MVASSALRAPPAGSFELVAHWTFKLSDIGGGGTNARNCVGASVPNPTFFVFLRDP